MTIKTGTEPTKTGPEAMLDFLAADERNLAWLARKLGHSVPYVYRMSTGERRITEAVADKLAALFDAPASIFLVRKSDD